MNTAFCRRRGTDDRCHETASRHGAVGFPRVLIDDSPMTRVDAEALEHHETERIFVAARLSEAQQVEDVLTLAGVEYLVKVEPFVAGIFSIFRPRNGAVFYVSVTQADYCRAKLTEAGLARGVIDERADSTL